MQKLNKHLNTRSKINILNLQFLILYYLKVLNYKSELKLIANRAVSISPLFNSGLAYTHQGRVLVKVLLSKPKVGFKFGMFAATKKPFNFRPKKKKQKR